MKTWMKCNVDLRLGRVQMDRAAHRGGHPGLFPGAHSVRGAHRGPYEGFFHLTKGKKNFLPVMMLLRFNSQSFSLFQEPLWSSFGIISYPI